MDQNRKTAYDVLLDIEKNSSYSNLAVNYHIEKNMPDNQAFVRELVYGVLKNKYKLDYIIDNLVASGVAKVKKQDKILLRMGLYQLIFMNSVPEYAAVSETVQLARKLIKDRYKFINGVLRGWQKKKSQIVFPDRQNEPADYLSVTYSVQKWIVELWLEEFGFEETERLLEASNATPDLSIRVNLLRTEREELAEMLKNEGFEVFQSSISPRALRVKGSGLTESRAYKNGLFSIQDEASIMVSDMLGAAEGDVVCDVCAAPGGKTFATAEQMKNCGTIYAMDIYEHKLELMKKQSRRTGVSCVEYLIHDSTDCMTELEGSADKVLCDVPCSGLGVLRRKPEIKFKGNEELGELVERQQSILRQAARYVRAGGILVYSTCTINRNENNRQIAEFLKQNRNFRILEEKQLLPTMDTDGFYICKLKKSD